VDDSDFVTADIGTSVYRGQGWLRANTSRKRRQRPRPSAEDHGVVAEHAEARVGLVDDRQEAHRTSSSLQPRLTLADTLTGGASFVVARFVLTRKMFGCVVTVAALVGAPAALALTTANSGVVASTAGARVVAHGLVKGTIGELDGTSFTVQTPGRRIGVTNALIATANRILAENTPYVYGGGHASAGNASVGIPGPGYNGKSVGFDCSGAVGAVLVGGGLWTAGSGVPRDDGIISQLRSEGMIAPGVGTGPVEVTLWDHPTVHIFMNIDGRFFGTSDGADGADSNGGAGWLYDGAPDTLNPAFKPYHLLPWVLKSNTSSGQSVGLQLPASPTVAGGLVPGEKVKVRYKELASGAMIATAISYPHSIRATGTVQAIAPDGSSFTLQHPNGATLTLLSGGSSELLADVIAGDTVRVSYTSLHGTLVAHWLIVTTTPNTTPTSPTTTTITSSSGGAPPPPDAS
jgi:hypothetical protein